MDEAERTQALDALGRWIEGWSGESGETTEASQEDIEAIWLGAWEACRAAHVVHYGVEERHDRTRPFSHQHYHAHFGAAMQPDHVHGIFNHPHTHERDGDHHAP
jgi:hypothetical protein